MSAVLCIDTTGNFVQARIAAAAGELAYLREEAGRGHAERLPVLVEAALETAGLGAPDIDRIAVVVGPGSYAGLRVGLSFAKGFAAARGLGVWGVSALDVWALEAETPIAAAVHDARAGEAVWRVYAAGLGLGEPVRTPFGAAVEAVLALAEARGQAASLIGSGAELAHAPCAQLFRDRVDLALIDKLVEGRQVDAFPPIPFYARPPDAAPPRDKLARG